MVKFYCMLLRWLVGERRWFDELLAKELVAMTDVEKEALVYKEG